MENNKQAVKEFWNEASCGENLYMKGNSRREQYDNQSKTRYELEPYIVPFADFSNQREKKVLEVGVGLGSDHQMFATHGAILHGIDLTERAIENTAERFRLFNLESNLQVADAENLPFPDNYFDMVYSWGVIHHSPNTQKAADEIYRVLKPNGEARIMIYYKWSMVGMMLWCRYALMRLRPFTSLEQIYSRYLESPGTKAYSRSAAKMLFAKFQNIGIDTPLTHGDLLTSQAGQRHEGLLLSAARKIYPRFMIRKFFPNNGLYLLAKLQK